MMELSMTEIESLTEEEYAYYLAYGDLESVLVQMHQTEYFNSNCCV